MRNFRRLKKFFKYDEVMQIGEKKQFHEKNPMLQKLFKKEYENYCAFLIGAYGWYLGDFSSVFGF